MANIILAQLAILQVGSMSNSESNGYYR